MGCGVGCGRALAPWDQVWLYFGGILAHFRNPILVFLHFFLALFRTIFVPHTQVLALILPLFRSNGTGRYLRFKKNAKKSKKTSTQILNECWREEGESPKRMKKDYGSSMSALRCLVRTGDASSESLFPSSTIRTRFLPAFLRVCSTLLAADMERTVHES